MFLGKKYSELPRKPIMAKSVLNLKWRTGRGPLVILTVFFSVPNFVEYWWDHEFLKLYHTGYPCVLFPHPGIGQIIKVSSLLTGLPVKSFALFDNILAIFTDDAVTISILLWLCVLKCCYSQTFKKEYY